MRKGTMKRITEFIKANPKLAAIIVSTVVISLSLIIGIPRAVSMYNEHQINKLETEKQNALKQAQAAHNQNLILQGQVFAKDEQIKNLTSQIADSNQRVSNAHNETQTARQNLNKVRAAAPHFNAADDAGRVREFSTAVRGLYSDSSQ